MFRGLTQLVAFILQRNSYFVTILRVGFFEVRGFPNNAHEELILRAAYHREGETITITTV